MRRSCEALEAPLADGEVMTRSGSPAEPPRFAARRYGRKPEGRPTREGILRSAAKQFAERGYHGATIRTIALDAQVDAALIHYFFGTKEELFAAAMGDAFQVAEILQEVSEPGPGMVGWRLLRSLLQMWDDPSAREPLLAVLRSVVADDGTARIVRDCVATQAIAYIVKTHTNSQHELRTALISSHIFGILVARYVLRIEPLAGLSAEQAAAMLAPALDGCLAENLPSVP